MSRDSGKQQTDVEALLIAKAWKDEAFKQALISDPKGTIEKEIGTKISDGVEIQVHEETETTLHFVLPPKPQEGELSDEELEKAAGGAIVVEDMPSNRIRRIFSDGFESGDTSAWR